MRKTIRCKALLLLYCGIAALILAGCQSETFVGKVESTNHIQSARTVVHSVYGINFLNPYDSRRISTGQTIKLAEDQTQIFLENAQGRLEPLLTNNREENRLFRTPLPDAAGDDVLFVAADETNSDHSLYVVNVENKEEKKLLDANIYGDLRIIDAIEQQLFLQGSLHSLYVFNLETAEIKRFFIEGKVDAVSANGQHVLYRKVQDDYVMPELALFNILSASSQSIGEASEHYFFLK